MFIGSVTVEFCPSCYTPLPRGFSLSANYCANTSTMPTPVPLFTPLTTTV
jgi:hypothetical protein